jgi:delta14-sterol reductase
VHLNEVDGKEVAQLPTRIREGKKIRDKDSVTHQHPPTMSSKNINPRTTHYEFLGSPGALILTLFTPVIIYALYFDCSETTGGCPPPLSTISFDKILDSLKDLSWWASLWDTDAAIMYLAWYAFCVAAWLILPGDWVEGLPTRTGVKKKYRINGMSAHMDFPCCSHVAMRPAAFPTFLLTLGLAFGYIQRFGPQSFTFIYDKWLGFVTASILMSVFQAVACHIASFFGKDKLLALGGNSGNHIYDVRFNLLSCRK